MNIFVASTIVWVVITYITGVIFMYYDEKNYHPAPCMVVGTFVEIIFLIMIGAIYAVYTAFQTLITAFVFGG